MMGAVFVAQGLQSPTPLVPSLCGGLVMLNTACAKGPLSAFRIFGRRMHQILDAVVIAVVIVMTVQPVITVDTSTRLIMGVLAFVLAFIWWQSDFSESARTNRREAAQRSTQTAPQGSATSASAPRPAPRAPDGTIADTVGRTAGRLAGKGVNIYRAQSAKRKKA
jgi:hypothetical protein